MVGNQFGHLYRVTGFGESHGEGLGVVIEGLPSGLKYDETVLLDFLGRRRPGGDLVSARKEKDFPKILSGVFEGKVLGTPLSCVFENTDARSEDYKNLNLRRGHADQVWQEKFKHIDPRGGGRSSGRETLSRVVAGAFAKMALSEVCPGMNVRARASSVYNIKQKAKNDKDFFTENLESTGFEASAEHERTVELLKSAKEEGQSYGGSIELRISNPIKSLGQPAFGKIKSKLAEAALSLGAVKSFSLGEQVDFSSCTGTDFHKMDAAVYGGVSGGISTGETIKFFCEIKPTSSILDVAKKGRHDPCIVPRVLVVLESMVWMVLMDLWLQRKAEV